ncbi:FUSC family protein [Labilithrix luteola]|uniref:FUSC family protein n=1 Tax=Labilithrix luteola TaxID=1391654 RepID=UPI0011BACF4D|nr:FUSC family protein [Labilithrix luteola]
MAKRPETPLAAIVPDVANGLRAGVATLIPFYLANAWGWRELSWTALGGWMGTLADPGGSRATRVKVLVTFTIAASLLLAASEETARAPVFATLMLAIVAFACSLLRVYGSVTSSLGTTLTIVVAIGTVRWSATPLRDALYFSAGAAWAMTLSTIVWPVWTHLPMRRTIGNVFAELSVYAGALQDGAREEWPPGDPRWTVLAREHRRSIRAYIEEARHMAVAIRSRRNGESRFGSNLRVLLGLAESQFPLLITLSDDLEALGPGERKAVVDALGKVRDQSAQVHRVIVTTVVASGARRRYRSVPPPPRVSLSSPIEALAARLVHAGELAVSLVEAIDMPIEPTEETAPTKRRTLREALRQDLVPLRDALSPASTFFRHALRVAGAATFAAFIGRRLSPEHAHWVTITTVAVLQPYPGATWTRAAERVVGTVFGSLVAVVITMTVRDPLLLTLSMFPLSVAAMATRPRSYRLFTFFLTPVFVVISARHPGDWWVAAARVGDALAGGAVALLAALVVFPSWEFRRLSDALSAMFESVDRYTQLVLRELGAAQSPEILTEIAARRRSAGISLIEAETSLERLLAEPIRTESDAADAMQLVTYTRRLAGAVTALETHATASAPGSLARDVPVDAVASYVSTVLSRARSFIRKETLEGPQPTPPELSESLPPQSLGLFERVLAHATLVNGLVVREREETTSSEPPASPVPLRPSS